MHDIVSQIAEIACTEVASAAIEEISKKTKVPPFHLSLNISGLVHDHVPCTHIIETCAYCKRNGNIFAKDNTVTVDSNDDIISEYKKQVIIVLEKMFSDITQIVYEKSFDNKNSVIESTQELDLEEMLTQAFGEPT